MHVVMTTVGTRRDVQPYVALGKRLAARGHRVTLALKKRIQG
jgi:UDP:flavonoid glycosyltransferase YjiC (YdhE family)